ncbi:MAG TPA: hypothetical protein VNT03_11810 [Baekduia sp.]|nr:hypothetical protein [Baekduia sp.]
MQTAPLARPEEVAVITRRILACACALALAVPAAAGARAGFDPPIKTQHVAYGDTKYDLQNTQDLAAKGVTGDTKNDLQNTQDLAPKGVTGDTKNDVVPAGKSAGAIASLTDKQIAAAYGGRLHPAHVGSAAVASTDDGTDGWRIAAVAEAGLLAAFILGAATFVGRMRLRRGATA